MLKGFLNKVPISFKEIPRQVFRKVSCNLPFLITRMELERFTFETTVGGFNISNDLNPKQDYILEFNGVIVHFHGGFFTSMSMRYSKLSYEYELVFDSLSIYRCKKRKTLLDYF
jgi:hypothetical protein